MSDNETVHQILDELRDLRVMKRELEDKLARTVMTFQGSWIDAFKEGIVKLNFPSPPGFTQMLRGDNKKSGEMDNVRRKWIKNKDKISIG